MKLSDIKDKNHSLFVQLKDLETDNVSLDVQIKEIQVELDIQKKKVSMENNSINQEIELTKKYKRDNEGKFTDRTKHKKTLELI